MNLDRILLIDPETLPGKLLLLVLDKLVIGALIALAFFTYDRWKTRELRNYNEVRQRTELGFQRAEYVKELVPVALDPAVDVLVRAQALTALIDTEAISPTSAVTFAARLLLSDVLAARRYTLTYENPVNGEIHRRTLSAEGEEEVLLNTMLKVLPSGLPSVLSEFAHARAQHRIVTTSPTASASDFEESRILNDALGFWIRLFREATIRFSDQELDFLADESFLANNLELLDAIVPSLDDAEADRWFRRENEALKTLGALRLIQERAPPPSAVEFLRRALNPSSEPAGVALSTRVIERLHSHAVVSSDLSSEALRVVLAGRSLSRSVVEERGPIDDHFYAATEYLVWSGRFPQVAEPLERNIRSELETFLATIQSTPIEALDYGNYPVEWALVRFLMDSNSASNLEPSPEAEQLLYDLFSIEQDKLRRTGLDHYAREWSRRTTDHRN